MNKRDEMSYMFPFLQYCSTILFFFYYKIVPYRTISGLASFNIARKQQHYTPIVISFWLKQILDHTAFQQQDLIVIVIYPVIYEINETYCVA